MATPTDDDNADDCISDDSYRCERGFTLVPILWGTLPATQKAGRPDLSNRHVSLSAFLYEICHGTYRIAQCICHTKQRIDTPHGVLC